MTHAAMKSDVEYEIRERWNTLSHHLDERQRRLFAATEAKALGPGGAEVVHFATGMTIRIIRDGIRELDSPAPPDGRIRRSGGGRLPLTETDPTLWPDLDRLVEPSTRGDPTSPLRWTCKSLRTLTSELQAMGHSVSPATVRTLLVANGYSLKVTRKTKEGGQHPDRNAQFEYIQQQANHFMEQGQPVISVDTKKKELVGDFKNGGEEWQPLGFNEEVNVHDFPGDAVAKAIPYGVYDVGRNEALVSVGVDHDTAEFAVSSILRWWSDMGRMAYPEATDLLITADCGGSNGYRLRMWKLQLQRLANETRLNICVSHLPPSTSKWNKIEHRLFCHITRNWRGRPLTSLETVVNLIASTKTAKGLRIQAVIDDGRYQTGVVVPDDQLAEVHLEADGFHGEWNYTVLPT